MTRNLQFIYCKDENIFFYCWKENRHFNLGKVITLAFLKERLPNHDHTTDNENVGTLEDEPTTEGMG